jgi:anthranilate synthase/aminodeoxychorismate synthase-like glutamine amidotransferase
MILLLDHDDSFVHTLARYVAEIGEEPRVIRHGGITATDVAAADAAGIILSPGPAAPADYPLTLQIIRALGPSTPILGVCLGHQCIGAAYGAGITRAGVPRHGMTSPIAHDGSGVFHGLPTPFDATRYHSLVVARSGMPEDLVVTASSADDDEIMGVRHRRFPVEGVQFHPESILSEYGYQLVANWLEATRSEKREGRREDDGK